MLADVSHRDQDDENQDNGSKTDIHCTSSLLTAPAANCLITLGFHTLRRRALGGRQAISHCRLVQNEFRPGRVALQLLAEAPDGYAQVVGLPFLRRSPRTPE